MFLLLDGAVTLDGTATACDQRVAVRRRACRLR